MKPLYPDPVTVLLYIRWMVFLATVLTWVAFILLLRCRSNLSGARVLMVHWFGHAGIWLGVNSALRLVSGYSAPTAFMSMWGTLLWIQASVSVIVYAIQWNRLTRHPKPSSTSPSESPSP